MHHCVLVDLSAMAGSGKEECTTDCREKDLLLLQHRFTPRTAIDHANYSLVSRFMFVALPLPKKGRWKR